jgi:eukaryotic-like serine/threonine-protein kinase
MSGVDIYALGIIAYECLTGSPPFVSDNPHEVAFLHVKGVPTPLPAELPPCVAAIVDQAMSKRAADRWRRPADLAVAARSCAAGHDTGWRAGSG